MKTFGIEKALYLHCVKCKVMFKRAEYQNKCRRFSLDGYKISILR